jgi:4-diphosphocytidyl-2C-methyl-D-erythritol kinase
LDWTKLSDHPPKSWSQWLQNDFEAGVRALHLPIHSALELLQNSGADYVQMTGTGSAAFGVFARESQAIAAANGALEKGWTSRAIAMNACL